MQEGGNGGLSQAPPPGIPRGEKHMEKIEISCDS